MFDLSKLEITDSAEYHVTDAKGDPQYDDAGNPITITVTSPGTKEAVRAQFKRDQLRSARVLGEMAGKTSKRTAEDEAKERAEFLAEMAGKCNGFEYPGGARAMYMNPKLGHITEGVEKFFNDRGNFAPGSSTGSSSTSASQPG